MIDRGPLLQADTGAPACSDLSSRPPRSPAPRLRAKHSARRETPMHDDGLLIHEALQGRSASFGQLVRKYQDRLYNAMVYVAGNREDAHDVVQEAFFRAFVTLDQLKRSGAFYAWLYRIAFHLAVRQRRCDPRSMSIDQAREAIGLEPVDPGAGPADQLEQRERCQRVLIFLSI